MTARLGLATLALLLAGIVAWCVHSSWTWQRAVPWPASASGEWPGAEPLRTARRAALRWPVQREAVEQLAQLYLANGFNSEALTLLPGIIARRPEAPEWRHRHAALLAEAGRLAEAVAIWSELRRQKVDYLPVALRLADALAKLNREDEAAAVYREILVAHPGEPYAWHGLVRIDVRHQRWTEARAKLATALAAAPNFYGHHALLQTVARQLGDEAAAAEADRAVKQLGRFRDPPDPWMEPAPADCYDAYRLRVDADRLRSDDNPAAARERIARAITLEPTNALNFQLLATIEGVAGNEAAAEQAYRRGLELDPASATLVLRYANLLSRQGRAAEELDQLHGAAARLPADGDIAVRYAARLADAGKWNEAVTAFSTAAELRPSDPELLFNAAQAAFRTGDPARAIALLRTNHGRHPQHEQTLGYLVMAAVQGGEADEARTRLRELEAVAADAPATAKLRAIVRQRFGGP